MSKPVHPACVVRSVRFVLIVVLGMLWVPLRAQYQNRPIEVIDQSDGLTTNSVFDIFQDSKGYMWFGTMGGLNRYDGYSFSTFKREAYNPNSLPDNWIQRILEDKDKQLWIGTHNGGLSVMNPKDNSFFNFGTNPKFSKRLRSNIIWGLYLDLKQRLWVGTGEGFAVINPRSHKEISLKNEAELINAVDGNSVNAFVQFGRKMLMGTWGGGLVVYDMERGEVKKFTKTEQKGGLPDNKVKDILVYDDSTVYITTQRAGLVKLNPLTWSFEQVNLGAFTNVFLVHIEMDRLGKLWLGTQRDGMLRYDPSDGTFIQFVHQPDISFSMPSNWVSDIYVDKSGLLWAATDMGVCKTKAEGSGFYNFPMDLLHPEHLTYEIRSLIGVGNSLWLGSVGGGLFEFDKEKKVLVQNHSRYINAAMRDDRIWALQADHLGNIWIGTGQGLICYSPRTHKTREYHAQATPNGQNLIFENVSNLWFSGKELWIGTWGGGFSILNVETNKWENYSSESTHGKLGNDYISDFFGDSRGRVWIGTVGGGLIRFDRKKGEFKTYQYSEKNKNSLSSNNINDIAEDARGNLWLATDGGGLSIFDPDNEMFVTYTEKDGLADNSISQIINQGKVLWLATSQGLSRFDLSRNKIDIFSRQSGLIIDQFSRGFVPDKKDNFWLSTINGFVYVEPSKVQTSSFDPAIELTKFKRFNRTENISSFIDQDARLHLSYDDYVITFDFSALDFRAPEQNRYEYILEGFHDKWIPLENQHTITFPALPHGQYTLRVRGTNSEGRWSSHELRLPIYVAPPYYKTSWFYTLLAFLSAGLIYLIIVWRTRNLHQMQEELQKLVDKRTEELEKEKEKVIEYSTQVERQRDFVTQQRDMIVAQNKEMTDSILYAKRIQNGLLPEPELIRPYFSKQWILFQPRDIVSGDFYWFSQQHNWLYVAVADCTGHGVPGAFMSLLGLNFMNQIMKMFQAPSTATMLNELRREVIAALAKSSQQKKIRDGIDIGIFRLNTQTLELEFSGAYNTLFLVNQSEQPHPASARAVQAHGYTLSEFKGQRMPIGQHDAQHELFTSTRIQLTKGDRIYLFTDGYVDQLNEKMNCKYYVKTFKEKLLQIQTQSLDDQLQSLLDAHYQWRGTGRQIDDILVMAFEI